MDAKVVTAPTGGDWAMETPMGEHCPWIVPGGKEAFEWEPIATLGDCTESGPSTRTKAFKEIQANARLIVAACNSYQRHCTDPVSAAEGDLLGRCVELLRLSSFALSSSYQEAQCEWTNRDKAGERHSKTVRDFRDAVSAILSQVCEVRG